MASRDIPSTIVQQLADKDVLVNSMTVNGSNGTGYLSLVAQSTPPVKPASGLRVYADADNNVTGIDALGNPVNFAGTTTTANIKQRIELNGHGFSAREVLYRNAGTWTRAQANSLSTSRGLWIVESVPDINHFVVVSEGNFDLTGAALSNNTQYYLSDVTPGALTATAPTATGTFVVPILYSSTGNSVGMVTIVDPLSNNKLDLTTDVSGVLPSGNGGLGSINGIVKGNGLGTTLPAVADTDYASAAPAASLTEAQAGTETAIRRWSPLRISQSIAALATVGGVGESMIVLWPSALSGSVPAGYHAADGTNGTVNLTGLAPTGTIYIQRLSTTPPTLSTATIETNGTTWTFVFSKAVQVGAGGSGGFVPTLSSGSVSLTYTSGSGTTTLVYTGNTAVSAGVTVTLAYTQPGNGIEDTTGNDLVSFTGLSVTNNAAAGAVWVYSWPKTDTTTPFGSYAAQIQFQKVTATRTTTVSKLSIYQQYVNGGSGTLAMALLDATGSTVLAQGTFNASTFMADTDVEVTLGAAASVTNGTTYIVSWSYSSNAFGGCYSGSGGGANSSGVDYAHGYTAFPYTPATTDGSGKFRVGIYEA